MKLLLLTLLTLGSSAFAGYDQDYQPNQRPDIINAKIVGVSCKAGYASQGANIIYTEGAPAVNVMGYSLGKRINEHPVYLQVCLRLMNEAGAALAHNTVVTAKLLKSGLSDELVVGYTDLDQSGSARSNE